MNAIARFTGCTLMELKRTSCRWPIREIARGRYLFCGCRKAAGSSYCEAHADLSVNHKVEKTIPLPSLNGYTAKPYTDVGGAMYFDRTFTRPRITHKRKSVRDSPNASKVVCAPIGLWDVRNMSLAQIEAEISAITGKVGAGDAEQTELLILRTDALTRELGRRRQMIERYTNGGA
jgi:hypothetical protein